MTLLTCFQMIRQILGFLALHLCWKCKHLTESASPSPEEIRYRESFLSQRESLMNKLTEYVVGTQSNAIEQVKRAVCLPFYSVFR
jgi:cohesin complex subunit SA-1/2